MQNNQYVFFSDGLTAKPIMTTTQTPLVAKVLTNAAGQVISVENLLAHQKQHGSLPQGIVLADMTLAISVLYLLFDVIIKQKCNNIDIWCSTENNKVSITIGSLPIVKLL